MLRLGGHQRLDRLAQVHVAADDAAEDVALGQDAERDGPPASHTKTESPVPLRWIARRHSASDVPGGTVTGWRRLSTPQALVDDGRDAAGDGGFGQVGHAASVVRHPRLT